MCKNDLGILVSRGNYQQLACEIQPRLFLNKCVSITPMATVWSH